MATCIITGAAAGNGYAIATRMRGDGHRVIAVDREAVPEDAAEVRIRGDVLERSVIEEAFHAALAGGATELHLVNNAGITTGEYPPSDATWSRVLDVNLAAPFQWAREYARHVSERRILAGCMVFIGSLATVSGFPRNPAYQASKAGLLGLTRSFAYDLGSYGIRVNCVSPGYIHTAMTDGSWRDPQLHEARRRHTLIGRWGESADVAHAVAFLCDARTSYVTGINLPVDGGWLARGLIES